MCAKINFFINSKTFRDFLVILYKQELRIEFLPALKNLQLLSNHTHTFFKRLLNCLFILALTSLSDMNSKLCKMAKNTESYWGKTVYFLSHAKYLNGNITRQYCLCWVVVKKNHKQA